MSDQDQGDNGEQQDAHADDKIIYFPELEKRQKIKVKQARKDKEKQKKQKAADRYRRQDTETYGERASTLGRQAQGGRSEKQAFINWDRIPIFTRTMFFMIVGVHVVLALFISQAEQLHVIAKYGFTPAFYTGVVPWNWSAAFAPFASLILHGSWAHLAVNSMMIIISGVFFERQFGARSAAAVFLICGFAGHLVYFAFDPFSVTPVVGASGAINGLFALTFMLMIEQGLMGPVLQKKGPVRFILLWLAMILLTGSLSANTSWQSHLGGFLSGVGLFYLWKFKKIKL